MKHLGKRVLSMILALGITMSMLVTDMSAMQVYAAGNEEYTGEVVIEEPVSESSEDVSEESSEMMSTEESSEEESSQEKSTEETVEEELSEEETETVTEEAETTEEEIETTTEEPIETTTEEAEVVIEESTEETTEGSTEEELPVRPMGVNDGFSLSADEDGRLVVEFEGDATQVSGEVEIPKEVKIIPEGIFTSNISVTKLTFEEGSQLETIEKQAFFGSSVTSLVFPATLKVIEEQAFHSSELENVVFEENGEAVSIGKLGFAKNHNLKKVVTNKRIENIGDSAFLDNRKLKETIDLTGVETIAAKAFYGCEALDYIVIPDTVSVIEESAFENCKGLGTSEMVFYKGVNAVQFGNGVTEIADAAFKGCTGLEELIIPQSVEILGDEAFADCLALKNVKILNISGEDATSACDIKLAYTSFPSLNGLVLEAYDGTVEDWVGIHAAYGVKFKTLYKSYAIKTDTLEHGAVKTSKAKAKMGEMITVEVTPDEGYVLQYGSLYYAYADAPNIPVCIIDTCDYTFEMPDCEIIIKATFDKWEDIKNTYGANLTLSKDDLTNKTNSSITYDEEKKVLSFDKPWQNVRIKVTGSSGKVPLCNQLKFTSNNKNAVTIDEKGNIRAIAPTSGTKITVEFADKENPTKALTFTVKVGEATFVNDISLDFVAPKAKIDYMEDGEGEAAEIEYDIITYPASILKLSEQTLTVIPDGRDDAGDKLDVQYKLNAYDVGIAKPKEPTFVGAGTITIPKGALGETYIVVEAVDKSKEPVKKKFIVRVIDDTPRLADEKIKVDPQSVTGTLLDLVSVYDATLDMTELSVCKKVVKKGNTGYKDVDDLFKLDVVDGKVYLKALENVDTEYKVGEKYTYKDIYFIHGRLSETRAEFYIPIPTLIVCKKDIKPTITMTGKINLFYNGIASTDKSGKVTVKQSQKDLVIEDCYLVGKTKTNGVNTDDDNAFAENFTVAFDEVKQTIKIVRTPGDEKLECFTAGKSKGQPVLNGKIRIKYEGYSEPFDIKITVPTHTTVPSYKLSVNKISLNSMASGQELDVSFINKSTKKVEDLILDETVIDLDVSDNGTTDGLIEESEPEFGFDADEDVVHLKFVQAKNGKVVLILRQPEWEDQSEWNKKAVIKASVTVTATNKYPTVKFGKNALSLNAACPDAADYTTMGLNQQDAELLEDQEFVAAGNTQDEDLLVWYDAENGRVVAEIAEGETVAEGTYRFECTPKFVFMTKDGDGMERAAQKATIKVKVKNAVPTIELKETKFKLNANCYKETDNDDKYDYVITGFKWKNLPAEFSDYTLSDEDKVIRFAGNGEDYIGEEQVRFEVDEYDESVKIYIESAEKVIGNSKYKVEGLKLVKDDAEVAINPISFKINCVDATPKVTVTSQGNINPLNPASKMVYTPTISNINGDIVDVTLRELDEDKSPLDIGEEHFTAVHDVVTGKTTVRVKAGEQLENRAYKIQLYYELSNGEGDSKRVEGTYQVEKDQKIVPKQTMPKINVKGANATFYAGNKERTKIVTVTKKNTEAVICNVKFAAKTSNVLQNAFCIDSFDPATGEMVLKLKNSAFVKQNVEQTLTFEIECEGQLKDTVGTTFTVKVKVIK